VRQLVQNEQHRGRRTEPENKFEYLRNSVSAFLTQKHRLRNAGVHQPPNGLRSRTSREILYGVFGPVDASRKWQRRACRVLGVSRGHIRSMVSGRFPLTCRHHTVMANYAARRWAKLGAECNRAHAFVDKVFRLQRIALGQAKGTIAATIVERRRQSAKSAGSA
jgi:hypothetical protein